MLALVLVGLATPASGWNPRGHQVVAWIAYRNLLPAARQRLDAILAADPKRRSLMDAAVWPDVERIHPKQHYVNIPYLPGHGLGDLPAGESVVTAIPDALKRLTARRATDEARADALAELIHYVADIHQPMHAVARFTPMTPNGDRGGNEVLLQGRWRNLHILWDDALDLAGGRNERPEVTASFLMARTPLTSVERRLKTDPKRWARESADVAVQLAYTIDPSRPPTEAYLRDAHRAAEERIVLAGYRLAVILNEALGRPASR